MTNMAAIGYMIRAAKALGLDKELIRKLEREMVAEMDLTLEEDAEKTYNEFC